MSLSHSDAGIVVIGGGIAGLAVCEALRERDALTPITLVCAEPRLPYDRVRLSEILVSGASPQTLVLRPQERSDDHHVAVLTGRRVRHVDAGARTIALDDGATLSYSSLVLATGSNALLPPIPGIDLDHVHAFRGPEDCDSIRDAAQ